MEEKTLTDTNYLFSKISQGDEASFRIFFEKYRDQLFNYIFKITKSRESAEEIVLDVFIKLWSGREMLKEVGNPDGFLYRIAHNKSIDFFRSVQKDLSRQRGIWNLIQSNLSADNADNRLLYNNAEKRINDIRGQLSPQRQKVLELRVEEGLSYDEIARRLDISPNTVRNHISVSMQFLREMLQREEGMMLIILLLMARE